MDATLSTLGFVLLILLAATAAVRGRVLTAAILAVAASSYFRLPQAPVPLFNIDEAITAAVAQRMQDGALLYSTVLDHKPPGSFYLYRVIFDLFGTWNMTAVHIAGAVLNATALILTALIARRLIPGRAAAWPAVLLAVFGLLYFRYDFLATNHELGGLPFVLLSVLLYWKARSAVSRRRFVWMALSGAAVMTGALFREACAILLPVYALALIQEGGGLSIRSRARRLLLDWIAIGTGTALILGSFVAWLAANGILDDAVHLILTHNLRYTAAGRQGTLWLLHLLVTLIEFFRFGPGFWLAGLAALVWLSVRNILARFRAAGTRPEEILLLLWCLGAAYMVGQGGRFHGHYFVLFYPPFALLLGAALSRLEISFGRVAPAVAGVLILATAILPYHQRHAGAHAQSVQRYVLGRTDVLPRFDDIMVTREHLAALKVLQAMTSPEDPVFVWGFSPQFYLLAPRRMATRFPFVSLLTGVTVGGTIIETRGEYWDLLREDIERERPSVVLDAAELFIRDMPLESFPDFREWLMERYRPVIEVAGCRFYELKARKPTEVIP